MSIKEDIDNVKNILYLKLSDPKIVSKIGISLACISAITCSLVLTDFGHINSADAGGGVCCYSNCYGNCYCYICCWI